MTKKTFVGLYHNETELITKIEELKLEGFASENIYVIARDEKDISMVRGRTGAEVQTTSSSWMDRFKAYMTGEEPIRGAFHHMGISDDEATRYHNDINNGGMLLYVDRGEYGKLHGEDYAQTNPYFVGNENGYAQTDADLGERGKGYAQTDVNLDDTRLNDEERIRLHEERINVNKERVQTGEVSVEKDVREEEQVIGVPVTHEEVYIERRPVVGREANATDIAFERDSETVRVPITEERLEVTKKPVVTEEIVIGKREVEEVETVRETVKKEEAHINRDGYGKDHLNRVNNDFTDKKDKLF